MAELGAPMMKPKVLLGQAKTEGEAEKYKPFTRDSQLFKETTSKVGLFQYRELDAEAFAKVPLDVYRQQSFETAP